MSALHSIVRRAAPHYEIVRVADYRRDGKQVTGYRAVHVILKREGFVVELQIRTRRQHAWAEAVERAANRTGFKLKDREGPVELVGFFRVTCDCLAELDDGRRPRASQLEEFRAGHLLLPSYFRDLPTSDVPGFAGAA
jgi:Region found in RelA / SpoT proteins